MGDYELTPTSGTGPKRRLAASQPYVRSWGEATCRGRSTDAVDPYVWSGRALQENFADLAGAVLHQCIRPLIGA